MNTVLYRAAIELGIFSFVINILLLAQPVYMLQVYDRVLTSSSLDTLIFLTVIIAVALLVLGLLDVFRQMYATRVSAKFEAAVGTSAFLATTNGPRAELGDTQPLRDLGTVRNFISSRVLQSLFDVPFVPFYLLLLLFIHPYVFVLTVAGVVIVTLIAYFNQRAVTDSGKQAAEHSMKSMASAQAFAQSAETIRSMGMMHNVIGIWGKSEAQTLTSLDDNLGSNAWYGGISKAVRQFLQVAIMGLGAWLVLEGRMTAGMIFATTMIAGRALQPIDQLIGGWRVIFDAKLAWERLKESVKLSEQVLSPKTDLPAPAGQIEAENLIYYAPGRKTGEPLIKRVNFVIPAGSSVGLIGPSGAGKSTLARLLCGAIEPTQGNVRIDKADIRQWDRDKLGKHIGYLSQNADMLPGTIAQNISRFMPDPKSEDIVMAAQKAHVHEMILGFPGGYEAILGPSGITLSGGQRQRIGLARAFFGAPKMLILDEPNSNLDADGDIALERAVLQAKADGITVVMVTQRKTSADKLDNLMIVRNGAVEEYGPRDKVMESQNAKMREAMQRQQAAAQQAQQPAAKPQGQVLTIPKFAAEKIQ
ncbi:MAG: type I secretion system permease/ATPase [Rhizobiaceae bacterium]